MTIYKVVWCDRNDWGAPDGPDWEKFFTDKAEAEKFREDHNGTWQYAEPVKEIEVG